MEEQRVADERVTVVISYHAFQVYLFTLSFIRALS